MTRRLLRSMALLAAAALAQTAFPIHAIRVEGLERTPETGVLRIAGLTLGQKATPADFEAAAGRITATGLFHSVQFRYKPSPRQGYEVTFEALEFEETKPVRLVIPDFEEEKLWQALQQRDPLLLRDIPASEGATQYYVHAIESYLAEQGRPERITSAVEMDLNRGKMMAIFRPEFLPTVTAVRYEGADSVPPEALAKTTEARILGAEYMEQTFRELLDNVRPLFEERGLLDVEFSKVTAAKAGDGVAVTVAVTEGPVYKVGEVTIRCAGVALEELKPEPALRTGGVANWREIAIAVAHLENALSRYGYLTAKSQIDRSLDAAAQRADLTVTLEPGPRSRFGELRLEGLPERLAARLAATWKLPPGAPLNVPYVNDYIGQVLSDREVRRMGVRAERKLGFRPRSDLVDVTVEFKR